MKISELNHLENVNESNVVKGGLRINASSYASANGILANASTFSSVFMSEDSSYGYGYYYSNFNYEYGSASSSGSASALAGYASSNSFADGSTEDYHFLY